MSYNYFSEQKLRHPETNITIGSPSGTYIKPSVAFDYLYVFRNELRKDKVGIVVPPKRLGIVAVLYKVGNDLTRHFKVTSPEWLEYRIENDIHTGEGVLTDSENLFRVTVKSASHRGDTMVTYEDLTNDETQCVVLGVQLAAEY